MTEKKRILTGDTPTGRLHLGHWVGSVENRLALQEQYDCYFLIANKHAFTTRADRPRISARAFWKSPRITWPVVLIRSAAPYLFRVKYQRLTS